MPGIGATSSLVIVSVAVLGEASVAPAVGLERVEETVSSASTVDSFRSETVKVFAVSPAAKLSVPVAAV